MLMMIKQNEWKKKRRGVGNGYEHHGGSNGETDESAVTSSPTQQMLYISIGFD